MAKINIVHEVYSKNPRPYHTGIEYFATNGRYGYAWDFITGCKNIELGVCGGAKDFKCWAKSLALGRNKNCYPFGFEPTLYTNRLLDPLKIKTPSKVAVCFKGDLAGEWIDPNISPFSFKEVSLRAGIFNVIRSCKENIFVFLTKNPAGWIKWEQFPDNAIVGATANSLKMFINAVAMLGQTKARYKWISFEPITDWSPPMWGDYISSFAQLLKENGISWLVIGGFSGSGKLPSIDSVCDLIKIADKAGIPVWLKNNLAKYEPQ